MPSHHCAQRLACRSSFPPVEDASAAITVASHGHLPEARRCGEDAAGERRRKRQVKLDLVRDEVQNGMLVIRQNTEEERRRYPPRTTQPEQPRRSY